VGYADNQGCRIYFEVLGSGPPLVLAHGFSSSSEDWRELGYTDRLEDAYQLILIDGRGHGRSDKPHSPRAYSPRERTNDVLAVLDELGIDRAHYWGYSAGGVAGFCLGSYAPERLRTLIIGGLDPYTSLREGVPREVPLDKPLEGLPAVEHPIRALIEAGPEAWLGFWEANTMVLPGMKDRLLRNDHPALLAQWSNPYRWREGVEPILAEFPAAALLYAGEAEADFPGMKACAAEMPRGAFVALSQSHHFDIFFGVDTIVPIVLEFLNRHHAVEREDDP
jgi:pimeloyl-ACP methyl ester carboxylesterase